MGVLDSVVTLAAGLAGAAIGSFFGPTGAAIGFSLGAAIGAGRAGGDPVEGPRVKDLRVTGASYGDPISRVYGTIRLPVEIIWSSGLQEKKSTKREGGGTFSKGTETTTYKYSVSLQCLICEGEIIGVRRIWMDSQLVYDAGDAVTAVNISLGKKYTKEVTVYTGSTTQTPDSYLEEQIGTGLVPAHRGKAYLVIKELKLKKFYNRIPNIEVEVVKAGAVSDPPLIVNSFDAGNTINERESAIYDNGIIQTSSVTKIDNNDFEHYKRKYDLQGNLLSQKKYDIAIRQAGFIFTAGSMYEIANVPQATYYTNITGTVHSRLFWNGEEIGFLNQGAVGPLGTDDDEAYGRDEQRTLRLHGGEYYVTVTTKTSNNGLIRYIADSKGRPTYNWDKAVYFNDLYAPFTTTGANFWIWPDAENDSEFWCVYTQAPSGSSPSFPYYLVRYDIDFNILAYWSKDGTGVPTDDQMSGRNILIGPGYCLKKNTNVSAIARLYSFDHETSNSTWTLDGSNTDIDNSTSYSGFIPLTDSLVASKYETITRLPLVGKSSDTLANVVSDICQDAGYPAGDIDVTGLTGNVKGYRIPSPQSARRSIEELQRVYAFDGAEVDDKLTWVMRGGASAETIPEDDMSAHLDGSQVPDLTPGERGSELELPRSVTVNYLNFNRNYEQGSQPARRQVTTASGVSVVSVNLVLTEDEAAQAADILLYNAHQGRETFSISIPERYQKIVPTDLITITINDQSIIVRVISVTQTQDGIMRIGVVPEHTPVYTSTRSGADSGEPTDDAIDFNGAAELAYMDIPILLDGDNYLGIYLGVAGYFTTWKSHALYKFSQDAATYALVASFVSDQEATIGTAESTLADFTGGAIDYTNTVDIRLANSDLTLASSTESAVILDQSVNRCLIGDEVIQFITATASSPVGTWTLSGLLRGRRGTEYARSTHTSADLFCMLDSGTIQRLELGSAELDTEVLYKFVGEDQDIDDVLPDGYTIAGEALRPFSPADVWAEYDVGVSPGGWQISWIPRTRLNADLSSGQDIDDDPEVTHYVVDIIDNTASPESVIRSTEIAVGTTSWVYDLSMIASDFSPQPDNISVVVYQKGATVTYGYGLRYDSATDSTSTVDPKA